MALSDAELERYARHIVLQNVGGEGQLRLKAARVLVVGAGGLGAPVLSYLAAAGVGSLGIVDDDVVSLSNLQRQIIHTDDRVGKKKVNSAKLAIAAINPHVEVTIHDVRLTPSNATGLCTGYDVIVDGTDNFVSRFALNAAALHHKIPLIIGALHQFEGQIMTVKPWEQDANGAPYPCYQCFVPKDPNLTERSCADHGVLGAMAGVIGTHQAVETLKEILGVGQSLAGYVQIFDGLSGDVRRIRLHADPKCPACHRDG